MGGEGHAAGPPSAGNAGRAALYLRLSREDGESRQSESIRNQQEFLVQWAEAHNIGVGEVYADDGYSGTTFDRPGFRRLLRDIEAGRVRLILTKDLSRLGRDYIMTGYYLERYFPEHRVRYLAVNDGIDTGGEAQGNDLSAFRSVFNDLYAKDISKKVRTALTTKKQAGQFIGAFAPYGYRKDPADKNRLTPEERTAPYVREIFRLWLAGWGAAAIADRLTGWGVPTPSQARGAAKPGTAWSGAAVRRILTNPTYCGDLTQNRSQKVSYKGKKQVELPREQWITVRDTHAPLISREDFTAAQRLFPGSVPAGEGRPFLLSGLVFCADCGAPMTLSRSGERRYLVCSRWKRHAKQGRCASHCVREDRVLEAILRELRRFPPLPAERLREAAPEPGEETRRKRADLDRRDREDQALLLRLYRDREAEILPEPEFRELAEALRRDRAERAALRGLLERREGPDRSGWLEPLRFLQPDRRVLALLVDRVEVGKNHALNIQFAFRNPEGSAK